ncbi:MAG: universal stress protein, partial [Bryobacterales bacterium]|nr:universal stress protein [Bryobacterales bacterium]
FIDAGLIVLGGRGSSLWERLRGESTADRIARATNRPILVVKRSGGEGIHTASRPRILCVLSPAETGDAAIEFARWLAEQSDGELLFCTASGETDGQLPPGATQNPVYRPPVGRAITHLRRLGASTTAPQRRIFTAQPSSRTIHTAVEQLEADIIVAPRRAVGGDSRIHLGLNNALRNIEHPIFLIAPDEHGARTTNEAPSPTEMLEYSTPHK